MLTKSDKETILKWLDNSRILLLESSLNDKKSEKIQRKISNAYEDVRALEVDEDCK